MGSDFEELDHTADWAFRVRAETLPALFVRAAQGMYRLGGMHPEPGGARAEREIRLDAVDAESLLVAWLNELLYFAESESLAFDEIEMIALGPTALHARLRGGRMAGWEKYIKAATYNDLEIRRDERGYEVTVVVDV